MIRTMKLSDIHASKVLQPRGDDIDPEVVKEYVNAIKRGEKFPPMIAFNVTDRKGTKPMLVAGFHRFEAYTEAGVNEVEVDVRDGTYAEAWLAGYQSNLSHGVRYTTIQKRRAISTALLLFAGEAVKSIAERLCVSESTVRSTRNDLIAAGKIKQPEKVIGRDGREVKATRERHRDSRCQDEKPQESQGFFDDDSDEDETKDWGTVAGLQTMEDNYAANGEYESAEQAREERAELVKELKAKENEKIGNNSDLTPEVMTDRITKVKGFPEPTIQRFKRDGRIVEKVIDMTGNPIPDCMGDLFVDNTLRDVLSAIEEGAELIDRADAELLKYSASKITTESFAWVDFAELNSLMKKFRDAAVGIASVIRDGLPFAVCPHCHGDKNGCKKCRLCGYWPRPEVHGHPALFRKNAGAAA